MQEMQEKQEKQEKADGTRHREEATNIEWAKWTQKEGQKGEDYLRGPALPVAFSSAYVVATYYPHHYPHRF
jgi:hypothetical protein